LPMMTSASRVLTEAQAAMEPLVRFVALWDSCVVVTSLMVPAALLLVSCPYLATAADFAASFMVPASTP
jgi:hypothetical protein